MSHPNTSKGERGYTRKTRASENRDFYVSSCENYDSNLSEAQEEVG